ncbi:MAG: LysR family transcriptional regulator [Myxococcales bacterium]|nr:LysR family transcriptional regulator [Myxococcales bacterium]MCB9748514.1 LysR family transcriptional regulator [Myxococcales bacterium]
MRTEDLRALFTVVETGSLTAAARRLKIPKSTLGRRLNRLEDELDAQLVIRTPRRTQITELGRRLHAQGEPLLAELDDLRQRVLDRPAAPSGELRVSAPEDLATALMGGLCGRFLLDFPKVQVVLVASNAAVNLLADGFDVALRIHLGALADATSVRTRRLGAVEVGLFAAPRYLEGRARPRAPADLSRHALLSMDAVLPSWRLHRARDDASAQLVVRAAMRSNDHHALRDAALAGAGIASLPGFLCSEALAAGALVRVLPTWTLQTSATLSLLWPATRHVSPRVRAFIDAAVAFFAERSLS